MNNSRQLGMVPSRQVRWGNCRRRLVTAMVGAVFAAALPLVPQIAMAQEQYVGRSVDVRTFVYFKVSDAALQKLVPKGWEVDPISSGRAAHANLRVVFLETMTALDANEKPGQIVRAVLFQIPVRQAAGGTRAMMLFRGLSTVVPGAYGTNIEATATVERRFRHEGATTVAEESWDLRAASGERASLEVKFSRGPVGVEQTDSRMYSQVKPDFYRVYRVEQVVDVVRTANDTARVASFAFKAAGGELTTLFDGTEQLVSVVSVPVYARRIFLPARTAETPR
jgi:hypothetical protein